MHYYITHVLQEIRYSGVVLLNTFMYVHTLIKNSLSFILDVIFPPTKRSIRVRGYDEETLFPTPMQHEALGISITTLAKYHQQSLEDTIRALKYDKSEHAANLLATMLSDYLLEKLAEDSIFSTAQVALVPIPLAKGRMHERGYNQITLVLDHLHRNGISIPVREELLIRTRETPPQTRLSRSKRLKNVSGAFSVPKDTSIQGLHVILIDDVTTTGATLLSASQTLSKSGAIVTPLALARA